MTPFDPAAWLDAFTAVGGSYALTAEGRLWLGEIGAPSAPWGNICQIVGHPERIEAIKVPVWERCLMGDS